MSDLLNKCEEFYSTRCFYEVLQVSKDASDKEIKKAYHKLSLLVHPDRVEESKKEIATEKFKVLGKIYSILQDSERRKVYDDNGEFDEETDSAVNWMDYWRSMFKKITKRDIENYERKYIGSETEIRDIKKAYVDSKGNMDFVLDSVPFSNCDSEPRIIEAVQKLVDAGEVEEYDCFFNEPQRKKTRRRRKWEAEHREAEQLNVTDEDLFKQIQENREQRVNQFQDFMTKLEDKYRGKGTKRKSIQEHPATSKKKSKITKGRLAPKTKRATNTK